MTVTTSLTNDEFIREVEHQVNRYGFVEDGLARELLDRFKAVLDVIHSVSAEYGEYCWSNRTPREWLKSLKWDGVERIKYLFTEYASCSVSTDYAQAAAEYWMLTAVARVLGGASGAEAGTLLVIDSHKEYGRSPFVESLAPPEFFTRIRFDKNPTEQTFRDLLEQIRGKMVVEIADYEGVPKDEARRVMEYAFITSRFDHAELIVPAFDGIDEGVDYGLICDPPRKCMFIATTDGLSDYQAADVRYQCAVKITKVSRASIRKLNKDRDQLWAEAVYKWQDQPLIQTSAHAEVNSFIYGHRQ